MILKLRLVKVNSYYCDYLRKFDNKVSYNKYQKELRPFIGVLFKIKNMEYFAPLTSPKPKHLKMKNNIDFLKIDGGKLGAINFNNMIPVSSNDYEIIYFNSKPFIEYDEKYQELLKDQLDWLNKNYIQVKDKSYKLYNFYITKRLNKNVMNRCCNFKLLEQKCIEYNLQTVE